MNNKLLKVIGGSALTAMLLAGCGANDNDPPPNNGGTGTDDGTTEINDLNRNDRDNRIFNNNRNTDNDLFDNDRNDRNGNLNNFNNNGNNGAGLYNNNNRTNDRNTDNDGDMFRDLNTRDEDGLEDRLDLNDGDNRDR